MCDSLKPRLFPGPRAALCKSWRSRTCGVPDALQVVMYRRRSRIMEHDACDRCGARLRTGPGIVAGGMVIRAIAMSVRRCHDHCSVSGAARGTVEHGLGARKGGYNAPTGIHAIVVGLFPGRATKIPESRSIFWGRADTLGDAGADVRIGAVGRVARRGWESDAAGPDLAINVHGPYKPSLVSGMGKFGTRASHATVDGLLAFPPPQSHR